MDTNTTTLSGRLNDINFLNTKRGNEYATFSLAINRGEKETIWVRLMIFDEKQVKYLKEVNACKGDKIMIHGIITSMNQGGKTSLQIQVRDLVVAKSSKKTPNEIEIQEFEEIDDF